MTQTILLIGQIFMIYLKVIAVEVAILRAKSMLGYQILLRSPSFQIGSFASMSHWTATLTVKLKPPRRSDILRKMLLGFYVDDIAWSRELQAARGVTQLLLKSCLKMSRQVTCARNTLLLAAGDAGNQPPNYKRTISKCLVS